MVMYDGDPASALALGEDIGLTFPILSDPDGELFERWDPSYTTPSTTLIDKGSEVWATETTWYTAQLEELLYGPED